MRISDLPYYVKFVFLSEGASYSTADSKMLSHIVRADSRARMRSLEVGDRIIFEPQSDKVCTITKISIRHIFDDTADMLKGVDLEDAPMQGDSKEWLLKVVVEMEQDN